MRTVFVEKFDVNDRAVKWSKPTGVTESAVLQRERARYLETRAANSVHIGISVVFCTVLLFFAGDALAVMWVAFLTFAIFCGGFLYAMRRDRAWYMHMELNGFEVAGCLCHTRERISSSGRRRKHYSYRITIEYGEGEMVSLYTDEHTHDMLREGISMLLLRTQRNGRTYYDVYPCF